MQKEPLKTPASSPPEAEWQSFTAEELLALLVAVSAQPSLPEPVAVAADELPLRHYNDLTTFLQQSSFAWHAELASRKWLEQGARYKGQIHTPRTTDWMTVLGYLNPKLNPHELYGISPTEEPEIRILRAYQLLLTDLRPQQVAQYLAENPLPDTLTDFLVSG